MAWWPSWTSIKEKRAEEAARHSEARLRKLIEASPIGIAIGDLGGGYTYGNPALQHLLGYSADEFAQGRVQWRQMTPPEWLDRNEEAVREVRATGIVEPHEKEYLTKDGGRVPVLVAGALLDQIGGGAQEIAAYVVDLTAQKQAEAELRDREALLLSIFRSEGLVRVCSICSMTTCCLSCPTSATRPCTGVALPRCRAFG